MSQKLRTSKKGPSCLTSVSLSNMERTISVLQRLVGYLFVYVLLLFFIFPMHYFFSYCTAMVAQLHIHVYIHFSCSIVSD